MRTKASRLKIIRQSSGLPAPVLSKATVVLDCDVHRSTRADWEWLKRYTKEQPGDTKEAKRRRRGVYRAIRTPRARRRQAALHPFWGKPLISANFLVDRSVFIVFVEPKTRKVVFWEERRHHPSGRITTRCSGPVPRT